MDSSQTNSINNNSNVKNAYGQQGTQIINRGPPRTSIFQKNASSENGLGGNNTYQGPPVNGME